MTWVSPWTIAGRSPWALPRLRWMALAAIAPALSALFPALATAHVGAPSPLGLGRAQEPASHQILTTSHQVRIDGRIIEYTTRAGLLPIRLNETGEVRGTVFFTYYRLEQEADAGPRPLTFLWNGGPGANSVLVHLVGFGPKRIRTTATPLDPPDCDCELEANEGTWLDFSDLVFVDPIGTGFSRPARAEYADEFYGVREDAAYIAEFIRLFATRFDAWDAPLFIGGESYGTWRAAGVAKRLEETGMSVAGLLLISGGVPVGALEREEMRVAHLITSRTATAHHHRKVDADLQADLEAALSRSEQWAVEDYAPALARRESLPAEDRTRVVEGLARFTGLSPDQIDPEALVINRGEFLSSLLEDRGEILAGFDTRQAIGGPTPPRGARAILVGRYLRRELGFDTDLAYLGLEGGYRPVNDSGPVGPADRWRYNHAPPDEPAPVRLTKGDGPPGARPGWVREAMALNPSLRVFVATGLFDSMNSCSLNRHVVSRLEAHERNNFTLACYRGGHVMYEDQGVRLEMKRDVGTFVATTIAELRPPGSAAILLPGYTSPAGSPTDEDLVTRPQPDRDVVTTSHSIQLGGRDLPYTARAGRLPLRHHETGEVRANVFFVSYSVAPDEGEVPRPVLFAWNGGPGSNAGLLHMTAMGPRRFAMGDVYATAEPGQMSSLVDNEATWLGATDLVFVDPVGTGYSRPTRAEFGPEFYDTRGDVESLAEFIRVYLTRFDAWDAPIFLAGESYGSLRAAAVSLALQERDIAVAGLVLISGNLGIGSIPDHLDAPLSLPAYTATAIYHGKLAPDLLSDPGRAMDLATRWSMERYAPAQARLDQLSDPERESVTNELARFTAIPREEIDGSTLTVGLKAFTEGLLGEEHRVLGRYDARLSSPREDSEELFDPTRDASLAPLENLMSGNAPVMLRYLRNQIRYESDLFYIGPFGGAWPPPQAFRGDWMSVRWNFNEGPDEPLRQAMRLNPRLAVLHASGTYDLVVPPATAAFILDGLEPELRSRITAKVYEGGHSFYLDRASRMLFMQDGTTLIERASAAATAR